MNRPNISLHDKTLYTAVIGDMLASKALPRNQRGQVQHQFAAFIQSLNEHPRYRDALASKFVITLGDEFQGILSDATVVPDLIWDVAQATGLPKFRLGIGFGALDTAIPEYAINLDGPALHAARQAIEEARSKKLMGGVFTGFGDEADTVSNGIARLLQFHWDRRTVTQREVLGLLRAGTSEVDIATAMRRRPQTINDHKRAAGAAAFLAGEQALRAMLKLAMDGCGQ